MEDQTLTHKDLSNLVGVSETTIKSYRRKFPRFIPVAGYGKPIRFKQEAGKVCLAIRECFVKGFSVGETENRLREKFNEQPVRRVPGAKSNRKKDVSRETLDGLLKTADQLMQGLAELAAAQAQSEERLNNIEQAVGQLISEEKGNREIFSDLAEHLKTIPQKAGDTETKARKIVTVRGKKGQKDSYSLEKEARAENTTPDSQDVPQIPPNLLLDCPVVIRSDKGEFLGLPGRPTLDMFVKALEAKAKDTGLAISSWKASGTSWVYNLTEKDRPQLDHWFERITTPKGNDVAVLYRLDSEGSEVGFAELQAYFREIRELIGDRS